MIDVGAFRNASIKSGAGFGTLVMAVVMLMQTVSLLRLQHAQACDLGAAAKRRATWRLPLPQNKSHSA
jgi:hypothetical protein